MFYFFLEANCDQGKFRLLSLGQPIFNGYPGCQKGDSNGSLRVERFSLSDNYRSFRSGEEKKSKNSFFLFAKSEKEFFLCVRFCRAFVQVKIDNRVADFF